jgi:hypothetical protein
MRAKEECSWCMSTQHIEREIGPDMPEEFKFRCSACHEEWTESHINCDKCDRLIDLDSEVVEASVDGSITCNKCKE